MQIPHPTMAADNLIALGRFHLAALAQSPETEVLAPGFGTAQDGLVQARRAREEAEAALVAPRVALCFSEWSLEQVRRGLALAAHAADNQSVSGPAFRSVFPSGLDAEIRPRGAAQVTAARAVLERLRSQPAAAAIRAEHEPRLEAGVTACAAKVEARRQAGEALGIARAREDGARETWVAAYDSNAGAIRTLFPRNRARQDLYFDTFRTRDVAVEDDGPAPAPAPTV